MSETTVIVEQTAPVRVVVTPPPASMVDVHVEDVGFKGDKGDQGIPGPQGVSGEIALEAHISSETPHPAYDDSPSFVLLYQNAKV